MSLLLPLPVMLTVAAGCWLWYQGVGMMIMMAAVVAMVLGVVGKSYFSKSYIQYPRTSFQQY